MIREEIYRKNKSQLNQRLFFLNKMYKLLSRLREKRIKQSIWNKNDITRDSLKG